MEASSSVNLQDVFTSFAKGKEMDGKTFAKFCKDTKMISKKLTTTDVDLIFAKVKTKGARKIDFAQFQTACEQVAAKKGVSMDFIKGKIAKAGGPQFEGTKADYVKFHDDKDTYTGVYAKGGPTNVDAGRGGGVSDLNQLCDRTSADVRGRKV